MSGTVPVMCSPVRSPSSRRAWIEIKENLSGEGGGLVALLAEGVDRNKLIKLNEFGGFCRPPRGGRG